MKLLFDTSAIIPVIVDEIHSERASDIWRSSEENLGLDLSLIETTNALWKKVRQGVLSEGLAQRALLELPQAFDRVIPAAGFLNAALTLGVRLNHPIYDCLFAVVARAENATLVTTDRRLKEKLAQEPINVLML